MDLKVLFVVFVTVFLAELGDKTQLATFLYASKNDVSKMSVFAGASLALIVASALAVLAGSFLAQYIDKKVMSYVAGACFILIGGYTIYRA